MKFAFDIPGYLCGHRFTQDKRYYDSANKRFYDLAGFNRFKAHCEVTVGTPAFSNQGTNSREGVLLDRTCQMRFVNPCPWEGTMIAVLRPTYPADNTRVLPWIFGDAAAFPANGSAGFGPGLTVNQVPSLMGTPQGLLAAPAMNIAGGNGQILVWAFAWDQETRRLYSTSDAITVNQSAADAGTNNGNIISMGWNGNIGLTGSVGSRMVQIGNLTHDGSTVADPTHFCHIFEHHFFKSNVLRTNLAEVKSVFDTLKAYYAITL